MTICRLGRELVFPPPGEAEEDGLLAVGGDLSPERLALAYSNGIFPWFDDNSPILWWSPDPRMVLYPGRFHCSRSLRRTLRSGRFQVTFDTAFSEVIRACAEIPRRGESGTWITREMMDAYVRLHTLGIAHSVECWNGDGKLAGGLYGVSLGACFFGESMFSREADASKTAMAVLCAHMLAWGMPLLDCQIANPHLERMGAEEIPRSAFLVQLQEGLQKETLRGRWEVELDVNGIFENRGSFG